MHRYPENLRTVLYLGTDPKEFALHNDFARLVHYPVIRIAPRPLEDVQDALSAVSSASHLLFTSKHAISLFFAHAKALELPIDGKTLIAVGQVTARHLEEHGRKADLVPEEESQEGVLEALADVPCADAHFFFPRSSLARPKLEQELCARGARISVCDLYDTEVQRLEPVPDLRWFDAIVFTSPSTVDGFLAIFEGFPTRVRLLARGPVTEAALRRAVGSVVKK